MDRGRKVDRFRDKDSGEWRQVITYTAENGTQTSTLPSPVDLDEFRDPAERVQWFDCIHSVKGEPVQDEEGRWLYFPDGASRNIAPPLETVMRPVPADPEAAARVRVRFLGLRSEQAKSRFERRRQELKQQAEAAARAGLDRSPVTDAALADLAKLRDGAQKAQAEFVQAHAQLVPPAVKARQERQAKTQPMHEEQLRRIEAISL